MEEEFENKGIKLIISSGVFLGNFMDNKELGKDPFNIFKQILKISIKENSDSLFFLGNLFANTEQSNSSMALTMAILKKIANSGKYTRRVKFKGKMDLNVKGENSNCKLPIFSIHGENDSPKYKEDIISPLVLLNQASFLNYLGDKRSLIFEDFNKKEILKVQPVIIEKNENLKLAVYFLSRMKETKLGKMLLDKNIIFTYPGDGFIKILCLNQKFDKGDSFNKKIASLEIHPDMLPNLFDYVIWANSDFKTNEVIETKNNFKLIKISNNHYPSLKKSELRERKLTILTFTGQKNGLFFKEIELESPRPFIWMRLTAEKINPNAKDGRIETLRSEQSIKEDVLRRLELYYSPGEKMESLAKPILKVVIMNEKKKHLNLYPIEQHLKELVANKM